MKKKRKNIFLGFIYFLSVESMNKLNEPGENDLQHR